MHILFNTTSISKITSIYIWIITSCQCKKSRAVEPEPGVFGSLEPEPEPLEKKQGAGAGAAKKLSVSSALREDKSIRKLYFRYSSLSKIVSFYG